MVALSEFHAKEVEPLLQFLATMDRGLDEELISTVSHNSTQHTRRQYYKTLKSAEQDEVCSLYNPSRGNVYGVHAIVPAKTIATIFDIWIRISERFIDIRQHIANELNIAKAKFPWSGDSQPLQDSKKQRTV